MSIGCQDFQNFLGQCLENFYYSYFPWFPLKLGIQLKKCSHHDIQMFIVFFPNNLLILPIGHLVTLWNLSFNTPYLLGPICESSHRVNYLNSFIHLFIYLSTHHLFIHSSKTSVFIFLNFG